MRWARSSPALAIGNVEMNSVDGLGGPGFVANGGAERMDPAYLAIGTDDPIVDRDRLGRKAGIIRVGEPIPIVRVDQGAQRFQIEWIVGTEAEHPS